MNYFIGIKTHLNTSLKAKARQWKVCTKENRGRFQVCISPLELAWFTAAPPLGECHSRSCSLPSLDPPEHCLRHQQVLEFLSMPTRNHYLRNRLVSSAMEEISLKLPVMKINKCYLCNELLISLPVLLNDLLKWNVIFRRDLDCQRRLSSALCMTVDPYPKQIKI